MSSRRTFIKQSALGGVALALPLLTEAEGIRATKALIEKTWATLD
ncbi:MAG: twin-arginine translocation signal domain-containing protein [Robiginitalea sp.]